LTAAGVDSSSPSPSLRNRALNDAKVHVKVTTAPAAEPVSDAQAVAHAKIDSDAATADAALITTMVKAARRWVEGETGHALITQTITADFDSDEVITPLYVPRPPFDTMTSVKTFDDADAETVIAAANYRVLGTDPARIEQKADGWSVDRKHNGFQLIYTAGYGAAGTDVPEEFLTAIKILFTEMYEKREMTVEAVLQEVKFTLDTLLQDYKIGHLTAWT